MGGSPPWPHARSLRGFRLNEGSDEESPEIQPVL